MEKLSFQVPPLHTKMIYHILIYRNDRNTASEVLINLKNDFPY